MNPTPPTRLDVDRCREQYPAFSRKIDGRVPAFLDGPAGSQLPRRVIDAVAGYLADSNANSGGFFVTSEETGELLRRAHRTVATFLGASDPDCVVFGPNMTTLTVQLARSLARGWKAGDEIVVTRMEHEANFTPWVRAAADAGATVRYVGIRTEDCTLDLDDLRSKLNERTRLVAVGCASNAVGTLNPFREVAALAKQVGALVFFDAVHLAPHAALDVEEWGCDFLACSAYKFFGPHVGILWGRRELLERLPAERLRTVPDRIPGRWMPGTPNHEGIVGTAEAIDYIAELGFAAISAHENELSKRLLRGLADVPGVRVWGIADPRRLSERVPTISFTHATRRPDEVARHLGERGVFVWHGNFYALPLTEALELEPDGLVRIGLLHYNTVAEVDRLVEELRTL